ncbi:nitrate reductase molybdenum cofactor assembly chaperone [Virgibacillus halodenitrificans]|jgi:nitrate reductase molybdenum cofactor assembly chaperone NarJ/NarW|uniref:nitrate reductase molybdenum cofactor assembly chaperone n=1 Tax=Virgibacillus halodenitrificans TaxID=1482 RepID=UPI0002DEF782|nr:nitrate reductase molybdenum cofactor assembly chaperone [Virgibacillus halodenitrificans]MEC2160466.1 nitrate reductase molybdenum cofactor assembly chaperone [Virgibacillus halodenitrificans]MYL45333.1 nitrate reductase molybdenum cofactor assembly chaperone [Virgibacillus halodenitrificans]MYL57440.1 nitrate reductase molybdenum cofactor assembly chaperone [Virgibacillus halodenitrificans]CDQ35714.1 Redox enzyme maturation protein NarJ [Virgibacillus halodenitrificans]
MGPQERAILIIASRVLSYPDADLFEAKEDINACMSEEIPSVAARNRLQVAINPLFDFKPEELQQLYVSIFDLKAKFGLYLSAHELGDSPKRGAALIKLQKLINVAGYDRTDNELADYIPMLLEFLAVSPETENSARLVKRLSVALQRIKEHLPENNPYYGIFSVLMDFVFPQPTREDIKKLEFEREEADLEELPYPIMYK